MTRLAALLVVAAAFIAGCGEEEEGRRPSDPDFDFVTLSHPDGTTYRCIYRYVDNGYDGGPALWCERLDGAA